MVRDLFAWQNWNISIYIYHNMTELTQEIVRELLDYDSETGILTWKERDVKWFNDSLKRTAKHVAATWNTRYSNKEAAYIKGEGYYEIKVLGKGYKAHRIIWLWMTGSFPKEHIDHINHNRSDNRWINLRSVSLLDNMRNKKRQFNNKTGMSGVFYKESTKRYHVYFRIKGKHTFLGSFIDKEQAFEIRKEAEIKYGFHENHGKILI